MTFCSIYDSVSVDRLRAEFRIEPQRIRRLRTAFFKKSLGPEAALAEIPTELRPAVRQQLTFRTLTVEGRYNSKLDGATKVLFRTAQGYLVETVVLRSGSGRTSLCVSSQVGCAANCDFCATGKMGMAHDLSVAEMLDQIVVAGELLAEEGRRVRNIVFMGMGEPFHNEQALYETVSRLLDPRLFHHTPGRILISSVGIPDAMIRSAGRFPEVHLALSLHSACQDFRQQIIPLAARYSLAELRKAVERINQIQQCSVMIEYLMLAGRNDSADDAYKLVKWLNGLRVHVNLIPFNPIQEAPHLKSTDRDGRDAFATILKSAGYTTTIRYSLGADIAAACGQLVQQENRKIARTVPPTEVADPSA
jgi:23S rRNA (adenine2503-C2)-methyltransferase